VISFFISISIAVYIHRHDIILSKESLLYIYHLDSYWQDQFVAIDLCSDIYILIKYSYILYRTIYLLRDIILSKRSLSHNIYHAYSLVIKLNGICILYMWWNDFYDRINSWQYIYIFKWHLIFSIYILCTSDLYIYPKWHIFKSNIYYSASRDVWPTVREARGSETDIFILLKIIYIFVLQYISFWYISYCDNNCIYIFKCTDIISNDPSRVDIALITLLSFSLLYIAYI
jgi:hypothetical protein